MIKNIFSAFALVAAIAFLPSCKKTDRTTPPEQATFANQTGGAYFITAPDVKYEIPVGVTTVSDKDRAIGFTVTSSTGAVLGTNYTLSGTSVVIPAGQATGKIVVSGIYSTYTAGRKDTLLFTLNTPDVTPSDYNSTYKLLMRGPCFDGDVENITDLAGTYSKTFENGSYGPYATTISALTSTGTKTATGKLTNLYESFGPVVINFDWTDPTNTKAEIPLQMTDKLYAAGQPFFVRTKPGSANKFSICNQKFSFILDVLVNIGGSLFYYDNGVVYTMGR